MPLTMADPIWVGLLAGHEFVVEKKNLIVPVGLLPPARVAVSDAEAPTAMEGEESNVVKVGVVGLTTSGSHRLVTGLLLASPL